MKIAFGHPDRKVKAVAQRHFNLLVRRVSSPPDLQEALLFLDNLKARGERNKNIARLPLHLYENPLLDQLEALGGTRMSGTDFSEKTRGRLNVPVASIHDPEECIALAGMAPVKTRHEYLARFIALGGSERDHRYLKLRILEILHSDEEKSSELRKLVRELSKQMEKREALRTWLRKNTDISKTHVGRQPTTIKRTKQLLAAYISVGSEFDELDLKTLVDNVIKIVKKFPRDEEIRIVQAICYDYLKAIERSPEQQKLFEALLALRGGEAVVFETSGSFRNRVYGLEGRLPINTAASFAVAVGKWAEVIFGE